MANNTQQPNRPQQNNSLDKPVATVLESRQLDPEPLDGQRLPPRVRSDMINLRRQIKSVLSYLEQSLKRDGVKLEMTP